MCHTTILTNVWIQIRFGSVPFKNSSIFFSGLPEVQLQGRHGLWADRGNSRHHFQDSRGVLNEHTRDDVTVLLWQKAVDLMSQVPKLCNDMMNLGRLQGYEVHRVPHEGGHRLYDHLERLHKSWLMISLLFICRANWPVRANCCSRRPSLWQSRTPASCPAPKSGGSSSLSRSSFSASC